MLDVDRQDEWEEELRLNNHIPIEFINKSHNPKCPQPQEQENQNEHLSRY